MPATPEPHLVGAGDTTHYRPADLERLSVRAERTMSQYARRGEHLWIATVSFRVDPTATLGRLDADNIFMAPAVGCIVCEQEYTPTLLGLPCPGDPSGTIR